MAELGFNISCDTPEKVSYDFLTKVVDGLEEVTGSLSELPADQAKRSSPHLHNIAQKSGTLLTGPRQA